MRTVILPDNLFILNKRIWWGVICMILADGIWLFSSGVSVDFSKAIAFFIVFACCMALSVFYHYARRDDYLFFLGQITAQLLLAILAMGLLSYLGQRLSYPLVDNALITLDHALGFDWMTHLSWVDAHPAIALLFRYAYFSSGPQIMLIVALLFVYKQLAHIQHYIIALVLTAIITIFLAAVFPAVGAYVHYNIDVASLAHVHPAAGRIHEAPLLALRSGQMSTLVFPLEGLVTFPSFHSALSALLIYASWPVPWLRRVAVPLNILVIGSTPSNGGHWLVDVLGGLAIAMAVITFVRLRIAPAQTNPAARQ